MKNSLYYGNGDEFRWIPRMLADMRHYPREEGSKENSLRHATYELLGGYKCLKFRGKVWDGDQILKLFLCRWHDHLDMITPKLTVNIEKKLVGHNPRFTLKNACQQREKSPSEEKYSLRKQDLTTATFNESSVSKIREQPCLMLPISQVK